ncbi:RmlC-like cupin domain-containing protein [Chytridium lagenaria]|nr:RmlC-like cupin domain-containing protein [Chytridium lagenaria]
MTEHIISADPLDKRSPFETLDPFLFTVYHEDKFPAGDEKMQAPRKGNGNDFNPNAPYRMYHGDWIPGFPQHPHRGFETITATVLGIIDHTDSLGAAGRYGNGDLQWMTAGKGIVHGEMFPLLNQNGPNPTRFFQIWINLPGKSKMCNPTQVMHWSHKVQKYTSPDGKAKVTVWAGDFHGVKGQQPPPDSWAADPANDVGVWHCILEPKAKLILPKSKVGTNRSAFFIEGKMVKVEERTFNEPTNFTLKSNVETPLENIGEDTVEFLILQGQPIKEPVKQYGPFVMNTEEQIRQAFRDYQTTRFGGWPWPEDAVVFPRSKGRFVSINGKEETP